jgi:hypothetical protein
MDRLKDELETTHKELAQARAEVAAKPKVRGRLAAPCMRAAAEAGAAWCPGLLLMAALMLALLLPVGAGGSRQHPAQRPPAPSPAGHTGPRPPQPTPQPAPSPPPPARPSHAPLPQVQVETVKETVEVRDTAKEQMLEARVRELEAKVDTLKKELEDASDRWGRRLGGWVAGAWGWGCRA